MRKGQNGHYAKCTVIYRPLPWAAFHSIGCLSQTAVVCCPVPQCMQKGSTNNRRQKVRSPLYCSPCCICHHLNQNWKDIRLVTVDMAVAGASNTAVSISWANKPMMGSHKNDSLFPPKAPKGLLLSTLFEQSLTTVGPKESHAKYDNGTASGRHNNGPQSGQKYGIYCYSMIR